MADENNRSVPPPPLGALSRSKSFSSLLVSRRSTSSSSIVGRESSKGTNSKRSSWFGIGGGGGGSGGGAGTMNSSQFQSGSTLSLNGGKQRSGGGSKTRKEPRPQRTLLIFDAIGRSFREAVALAEQEAADLKSSNDKESQEQLQGAERYLKRLDVYQSSLDELHEEYTLQNRLRDGVRAIGKAYVESLGPKRDTALTNVRFGFKECNEVMCGLEERLEKYLGVLHVQMKGLQGYARLCPGDVFEISIKHGAQKWRTKGKVARDGAQSWDSTKFSFKVLFEEPLVIRAAEIRSLGKQVPLGNQNCETLGLFCAQPQMMTVSLTSSLKLNLFITWDPLYGNEDDHLLNAKRPSSKWSSSRTSIKTSSFISPGTMSSMGSFTPLSTISYESEGSSSPDDHDSGQSSTLNSSTMISEYQDFVDKLNIKEEEEQDTKDDIYHLPETLPSPDYSCIDSQESLQGTPPEDESVLSSSKDDAGVMSRARSDASGNFLLVRRTDSGPPSSWWSLKYHSSPTHTVDSGYADDSVHASKRHRVVLNQIFSEEEEADEDANATADWSAPKFAPFSPSAAEEKAAAEHVPIADWTKRSCTLEQALQYLNNAIDDIQGQYSELELFERSISSLYQMLKLQIQHGGSNSSVSSLTVSNVLECFDFLDAEPSEENATSRPISPAFGGAEKREPFFTAQLDEALLIHLLYCRHLVESLGNYGPLKCREQKALDELQVQGRILAKIAKLIEKWQANSKVKLSVLEELRGLPHLQKLWGVICSGSRALSIPNEDAYARLLPLTRSSLPNASKETQEKVLRQLIARCQDVREFNPSGNLTVFQFRYFVRSKERSFQIRLEEICDEMETIEALLSKNPQLIQKTITRLMYQPAIFSNAAVFLKLSHLLLDPNEMPNTPRALVTSFIKHCCNERNQRKEVLRIYIEGLESTDAADREGGCEALGVLQDVSVVDQLAYIAQSDPSPEVRKRAKMSLDGFAEGRDALQQLQLSSHGFQGIAVK